MRTLLLLGGLCVLLAACGGKDDPPPRAPRISDVPTVVEGAKTAAPPVPQVPVQQLRSSGAGAFAAHRGSTLAAYWSPDGERILTTSLDLTARLWDRDGQEVAVLEGHVGSIHQAEYSPDGTLIVTASVDHTARIWNAAGEPLAVLRHDAEVKEAHFTADGRHVWTIALDGDAGLWTNAGEAIRRVESGDEPVEAAWASADGTAYVAVSANGGVAEISALGLVEVADGHTVAVDDAVGLVGCGEHAVLLRDSATAIVMPANTRLEGHGAPVLDAAFAEDGAHVLTGSLDGTARLWDADGKPLTVFRGHRGGVFDVSFRPYLAYVLTVSSDRTARLWDFDGRLHATFGSKRGDPIASAAFRITGDLVLTTPYAHGVAQVWDLDGRLLFLLPDATGRTLSATWSPGGDRILTIDRNLTPHVFALADSEPTQPVTEAAPTGPLRGDYAGTATCASCHREAYEGWARSSHARTSYFTTEDDLPADVLAEKRVEHSPLSTTFRREGDGWIARTMGEDGEEHDYELTMIAGHLRVRFFMTRLPDGRLQVMPAMYELPKDTWFDYSHLIFGAPSGDFETPPTIEPGSSTFWTGPVRSWDAGCAHCHMSGKTPVAPGPDGVGPRSLWRAYAVDCEACHGPGRLHAEAWQRMEMDEPLVRLETLPRQDQVALCTQCHQEGQVLEPPYVLGQDLYDYIDPTLVIDPERADPAGRPLELIYDGLPFATSHCANAGGISCSYCHAPHGSRTRSLLRRPHEDGSFCVECHADLVKDAESHHHHQASGSGAPCVACHLPFVTIERGHGAVADHTIGIPRLGLHADRVQPDACTWCHTGGLNAPTDAPHLTEDELQRGYENWWPDQPNEWPRPWMAALASARLDEEGAGPNLVAVIQDPANPREVRASAARLLVRYADVIPEAIFDATRDEDSLVRRSAVKSLAPIRTERADQRLVEALDDPSWAVRVAAARTSLEGWARVQGNRRLLEKVIPVLAEDARKVPDDDLRWFRLGAAYDLQGDRAKALAAYERKAALDPFSHAVRRHVKNLRALMGLDTAEEEEEGRDED